MFPLDDTYTNSEICFEYLRPNFKYSSERNMMYE